MKILPPAQQQLTQAQHLYQQRRYREAEALLAQLLAGDPDNREALEMGVMLSLQRGNGHQATGYLQRLVSLYPSEPLYCDRLATLLERQGMGDEACGCYERLLSREPGMVASRFNFAGLLRRLGHNTAALQAYQCCLDGGIDKAEEVLGNMGSILTDLHRDREAEEAFSEALARLPSHVPALYNLALLRQEQGNWRGARELYRRVLEIQPGHPEALARLAEGSNATEDASPLLQQISAALDNADTPVAARESLAYGRGKLLDDRGEFSAAFTAYAEANALSRLRVGPYDHSEQAALVDKLIAAYDGDLSSGTAPVSMEPLVFICGMFRSGSTLLEQMLGSHPGMTAGGEIDFFQRRVPLGLLLEYPAPSIREAVGADYMNTLRTTFGTLAVSNKRPDNFLYLGLLNRLFPNARVLATRRQPLDNALSVFFQQLDGRFTYANELRDISHYMHQQQRLMAAWDKRFGNRIMALDYEQLVAQPRDTLAAVLDFLGLPWDERCLDYHKLANRVRTASVAQVRQPLYTRACNRWLNYREQLQPLLDEFNGLQKAPRADLHDRS